MLHLGRRLPLILVYSFAPIRYSVLKTFLFVCYLFRMMHTEFGVREVYAF